MFVKSVQRAKAVTKGLAMGAAAHEWVHWSSIPVCSRKNGIIFSRISVLWNLEAHDCDNDNPQHLRKEYSVRCVGESINLECTGKLARCMHPSTTLLTHRLND